MMSAIGKNRLPTPHGLRSRILPTGCGFGFTLIEVLVALVILSTGLVLVLRAFETSMAALSEARDALRASLLIREQMGEAEAAQREAGGDMLSASDGRYIGRYSDFRWEREVHPFPVLGDTGIEGEAAAELAEVTITIRKDGSDQTYSATTLLRAARSN